MMGDIKRFLFVFFLLVFLHLKVDLHVLAFNPSNPFHSLQSPRWHSHSKTNSIQYTRRLHQSKLNMVFDFIRKRSEEGIAQVQNIATKTMEGKLSEALNDSYDYILTRQKIDAENLRRLTDGLSRSRQRLISGINSVFVDANADASIEERLEGLEAVLLQADIGSTTTNTIISDLRSYAKVENLKEDDIMPVLRNRLIEALKIGDDLAEADVTNTNTTKAKSSIRFSQIEGEPTVIFVIGANGMGKTTTIGKIASRLRNEGNVSVLLGACDTFRAAAVEQLVEWSKRANVSIETPTDEERESNNAPSVVSRSVKRAKEENFDVVIIDTSGRLSNNFELIDQLQSMKAMIQNEIPTAPHETLLVVDGSVGRNAVDQAEAFRKYVGVTGLAITKLDGTARGGFVVSVVKDLGIPVKFIGVGEQVDDLRDFQAKIFVDALLGNDEPKSAALEERVNKMLKVSSNVAEDIAPVGSSKGLSPADRLKSSFTSNYNSNKIRNMNDDGIIDPAALTAGMDRKRPKRVKPAANKKQKKKRQK